MQPGDELLMRKVPKGRFSLDTTKGRANHLLVSTVTGVAPFVSYVRALLRMEGRPIRRHSQTVLAERREPSLGIWIPS